MFNMVLAFHNRIVQIVSFWKWERIKCEVAGNKKQTNKQKQKQQAIDCIHLYSNENVLHMVAKE